VETFPVAMDMDAIADATAPTNHQMLKSQSFTLDKNNGLEYEYLAP
jgi:hypothetical protein